jgi:hypothetical protein
MMFGEQDGSYSINFSDDEGDSRGRGSFMEVADDGSNWDNFVLRFGKYKGSRLGQMITDGRTRGYLRYILKWPDVRPNTALNINKALAHYEKMKEDRGVLPPAPVLTREYSKAR